MNRQRTAAAGTWLIAGLTACVLGALCAFVVLLADAGLAPFWPAAVEAVRLHDGREQVGELAGGDAAAIVLRTSEIERIGDGYRRLPRAAIAARTRPADAIALTLADGRRLFGRGGPAQAAALLATAATPAQAVDLAQPNALGALARLGAFARGVGRFLGTPPSASSLIGGVLPALLGTVTLVLLMSAVVLPLGVATAAYLHRRRGAGARVLRGAINMLAGVPSIVYGVLGLGLLVHGAGAGIDRLFYAERLPMPTFGSGGLLWAALTLALLTLPVVVVSIEEGLARVAPSLGEGSLALGATRDETFRRLLLPAIRPALLTGLVLAIARAAGAVAPLMLVGVVKLAPALPLDATFPYLHPSRQFMHLGFAVYDSALASADAIRGVPRAYACAALLVAVVVVLNLSAILLRNRLRERYRALDF
ncbi:MAG TPA: ABC transporter permease subunit [Dokdonella sp.]